MRPPEKKRRNYYYQTGNEKIIFDNLSQGLSISNKSNLGIIKPLAMDYETFLEYIVLEKNQWLFIYLEIWAHARDLNFGRV